MAEMSQNLLKIEAARCNNLLTTQKKLITEKMSRCKELIRQFHLEKDCGLSITSISQEIDSTYRRTRVDLGIMVDNWNEFIRLAVLSKEPQPVTSREKEDLKKEIDQQTEMINDYTRSVNIIKLEHLDTFKQIEDILKPQPAQQHQTDINLRSELRPTPLTANSSLIEVITFSRDFSRYVQSGNCQADQLPEGTIFDLAKTNVDNFWMTMLTGWGFEKRTQLHEFIALIEAISKNKFSICDRRSELFGL